jgi:hypothetical protein
MKKIIFLVFLVFVSFFSFTFFFSSKEIKIKPPQTKSEKIETKEKRGIYLEDLSKIRKDLISKKSNFLEVNLGEMKVKIYKEGSLIKEVPISKRGNPQRWGGTPVGIYRISSKQKVAYSVLANSFMPWALHIYGKYWIHGDNWYPDRGIDTSPITGGCVRLSNENAKVVFDLVEVGWPVLVSDKGFENDNFEYPLSEKSKFPQVSAKSYLVADIDSCFVFAQKDIDKKLPRASITKLITAIIIAEMVDLRKEVIITPEMLLPPKETKGLEVGKSFRAFELFYPLLIESSNDSAEALGYFLGKERTIKLMNEKAKKIMMENTNFSDLSGLSPQNVSTAKDLFYLARYILVSRPMFFEISRGKEVWSFGFKNRFNIENLKNENIFFNEPNFLGGKTGFIQASQSTGVFVFKFPLKNGKERKIAIILLGSPAVHGFPVNLEKDVRKILDWLKENYFE